LQNIFRKYLKIQTRLVFIL